jgi:hypothetical protein
MNNAETLKTIIFKEIVDNPKFNFTLLGNEFKGFHQKKKDAKSYLNNILDNLDIRFLDNIDKDLFTFPNWFKNNQYYIDYNKYNQLDFIIIN